MTLTGSGYDRLQHGSAAPEFSLKGTDGKMHSLGAYATGKGLLVILMCNHCPYVRAKFEAINGLAKKYGEKGIPVVGINPNDPTDYSEDSFESMVKTARENGFAYDYLVDETQETAKAFGAVCTPDPFLFDKDMKLVYHGRIDDAHGPGKTATTHELDDAMSQLASGSAVSAEEHPSMGCSIKWGG